MDGEARQFRTEKTRDACGRRRLSARSRASCATLYWALSLVRSTLDSCAAKFQDARNLIGPGYRQARTRDIPGWGWPDTRVSNSLGNCPSLCADGCRHKPRHHTLAGAKAFDKRDKGSPPLFAPVASLLHPWPSIDTNNIMLAVCNINNNNKNNSH